MNVYEDWRKFAALFDGLPNAFGTGQGRWVKRPPRPEDWIDHLEGKGPGMGIAPLRPDNTVMFAAIDLDEPDFEAARQMQRFIPGPSFIERSRSGNAHVWVFFDKPLEAWIAMGILREACLAASKEHVEIFPKNHDFANVKLGNYINLPYHGKDRPVLFPCEEEAPGHSQCEFEHCEGGFCRFTPEQFISEANEFRNDPDKWRDRARWLMLPSPEQRSSERAEFGTRPYLHRCAQYVIDNAEDNPVVEGHRAVVYFSLAKMLLNCTQYDRDEALGLMQYVNSCSPDRISDLELARILSNAERGGYTSTGCDDPLFAPYADPECKIANP